MTKRRRASELRSRKSPVQSRSRATVDAILTAAAQVFTAHGYAAGTTSRIAERAGVSIGSLYEYFPNKDALLVAIFEAHIREGETLLEKTASELRTAGGSLASTVKRFVAAVVELHTRDPKLHRVLFEETPMPSRVRRMRAESEERDTAIIASQLKDHPEFARHDAALAARIVVQTVEALVHNLIIHDARAADVERRVDEIVALIVAYLTTPERRA
jgi:AcrR family transcriptional regulator